MKHSIKITMLLLSIFFLSQLIGLAITNSYIDHKTLKETGNIEWSPLPYNIARPELEAKTTFTSIILAILIGTVLLLFLIRFKKITLWKLWFFFAVSMMLAVSFNAFLPSLIALILAILLSIFKIFKPNIFIHNITELFIYGGLAAVFVPLLNIFWVFILLIAISIYDMFAVWGSKHMVSLAKFQAKSKVFAGLLVPYTLPKKPKTSAVKKVKIKTAILGGGDIGFPLLFAGVVMKDLMLVNPIAIGFLKAMIIPLFTTIALALLFIKGKKDRFYPAMPFISIGCFVGYLVLKLFF